MVVDSLELELDDEYPDGDLGDILSALGDISMNDDDCDRVRSAFWSIWRRLSLGNGVGGRSLTGLNSMVC